MLASIIPDLLHIHKNLCKPLNYNKMKMFELDFYGNFLIKKLIKILNTVALTVLIT